MGRIQRVLISGNPHLLGLIIGAWPKALCPGCGPRPFIPGVVFCELPFPPLQKLGPA